jgi:hypothetical protein
MRTAGLGLAVGLGLVVCAVVFGGPQPAGVRPGGQAAASDGLVALSFDLGDGRQQITVVEPRQQVVAVYHVDKTSGAIALKSVRSVRWDLLMEEFNTTSPAPRDIRTIHQK